MGGMKISIPAPILLNDLPLAEIGHATKYYISRILNVVAL